MSTGRMKLTGHRGKLGFYFTRRSNRSLWSFGSVISACGSAAAQPVHVLIILFSSCCQKTQGIIWQLAHTDSFCTAMQQSSFRAAEWKPQKLLWLFFKGASLKSWRKLFLKHAAPISICPSLRSVGTHPRQKPAKDPKGSWTQNRSVLTADKMMASQQVLDTFTVGLINPLRGSFLITLLK